MERSNNKSFHLHQSQILVTRQAVQMKSLKGRILKKLISIPQATNYLKQGRILHLNASDGLPDSPLPLHDSSNRALCDLPICSTDQNINPPTPRQPEVIDVSELMKDLEDDDDEYCLPADDKENIMPPRVSLTPLNKKKEAGAFRRPELESESLFDPDLLAAFEQAVADHILSYEEAKANAKARALNVEDEYDPLQSEAPPSKVPRIDDPLGEFEERCPPGGRGAVVLYTTSLRGVRKTFEDCGSVRYLLESARVVFDERDVSMHMEFREELWKVLEERAIPPRLFVKGKYIGGAGEVLALHEQGRLLPLLEGMPVDQCGGGDICGGCAGLKFVVCFRCCGSRKVYNDNNDEDVVLSPVQCRHCNENGLVLCPICCC